MQRRKSIDIHIVHNDYVVKYLKWVLNYMTVNNFIVNRPNEVNQVRKETQEHE